MDGVGNAQIDSIQNNISALLGEYGWMFLAGLSVLFFKTTIESVVAGLMVFVGNDYNNDDIVVLERFENRETSG